VSLETRSARIRAGLRLVDVALGDSACGNGRNGGSIFDGYSERASGHDGLHWGVVAPIEIAGKPWNLWEFTKR